APNQNTFSCEGTDGVDGFSGSVDVQILLRFVGYFYCGFNASAYRFICRGFPNTTIAVHTGINSGNRATWRKGYVLLLQFCFDFIVQNQVEIWIAAVRKLI